MPRQEGERRATTPPEGGARAWDGFRRPVKPHVGHRPDRGSTPRRSTNITEQEGTITTVSVYDDTRAALARAGVRVELSPASLWAPSAVARSGERVAELIPASDKRVDVYMYTQDAPGGVLAGLAHRRYARPAVAARDIARWLA